MHLLCRVGIHARVPWHDPNSYFASDEYRCRRAGCPARWSLYIAGVNLGGGTMWTRLPDRTTT